MFHGEFRYSRALLREPVVLGRNRRNTANTQVAYQYTANGDLQSDGLRRYTVDAEGRIVDATTGATDESPTTRYAHNALGQRVFKTEPQYTATPGDEANATYLQSLFRFFSQLWSPTSQAKEKLGYAYSYDEDGTLIAEAGSGGANSAGNARYIYLPTANGPMPIAAVINGKQYAVHSDHLNTPRRLTQSDGKVAWQWSYSGFGEVPPTTAKNRFADLTSNPNPGTTAIPDVAFNLRYPGQYADKESGLFYNYFRTYQPGTGRYVQPDPIGLEGGVNRFEYVGSNPLSYVDPLGLDRWWEDLSLKKIPLSDSEVKNWLCRAKKTESAYSYLYKARKSDFDRYDSNLVAAERYMEGYDGNYSEVFIAGQHVIKNARRFPGGEKVLGRNGSRVEDSSFVTRWGIKGNWHRRMEEPVGGNACVCE